MELVDAGQSVLDQSLSDVIQEKFPQSSHHAEILDELDVRMYERNLEGAVELLLSTQDKINTHRIERSNALDEDSQLVFDPKINADLNYAVSPLFFYLDVIIYLYSCFNFDFKLMERTNILKQRICEELQSPIPYQVVRR